MRLDRHLTLVLAGLAALTLPACSAGPEDTDPLAVALGSADDPETLAALAGSLPAPQAAVLEDGLVTDGEYQAAIAADRDCVAAAGLRASAPTWTDGELGFEAVADYPATTDPRAADAAALAAIEDCRRENSAVVATVWSALH